MTTKQGATTKLATQRIVDGLGRLHKITQTNALGTMVASDEYGYDSRHRRNKAIRSDGNAWNYGYNNRNEVTSGSKATSTGTPLDGYQYGYTYDAIGNRDNTTTNGHPVADYSVNNLNQYTSRQVPGFVDVLGDAPTDTLVKVNGEKRVRVQQMTGKTAHKIGILPVVRLRSSAYGRPQRLCRGRGRCPGSGCACR